MYHFTMPADEFDEANVNKAYLLTLINKHRAMRARFEKLKRYYDGQHDILDDKDKAIKLVCNHAKDIADTASSYFLGNPISYKSDEDITDLLNEMDYAECDATDGGSAVDLAIYGCAYEYIYVEEGDVYLKTKTLSPENTFVVYDDSIEEKELFAVYYYKKKDDTDRKTTRYIATVFTTHYKWVLDIEQMAGYQAVTEKPVEHFFNRIPIIEYLNNSDGFGDFELQIPLIDAYNAMTSDRVIDKEQFIDAILVIYGTLIADDDGGTTEEPSGVKAMRKLKKEKLLQMPDASKAEYLTRTFDESGMEILRKAIEQDIHKFSHIPCLTDENFSGNTSGVAMEYKLLGIENITKTKERYYRRGLKKRLAIFCGWLETTGYPPIDPAKIKATFTRALPKNLVEISNIVRNLQGIVSNRTLLSQIPFVDSADEEMKAVDEESEKNAERQRSIFSPAYSSNEPLTDDGTDEPDDAIDDRVDDMTDDRMDDRTDDGADDGNSEHEKEKEKAKEKTKK